VVKTVKDMLGNKNVLQQMKPKKFYKRKNAKKNISTYRTTMRHELTKNILLINMEETIRYCRSKQLRFMI